MVDTQEQNEILETKYTDDEQKMISILKSFIDSTNDAKCPIQIYKSEPKSEEEIKELKKEKKAIPVPIISFKLDQSLSSPRWFWIQFQKKQYKIHIVLPKIIIDENDDIADCLALLDYSVKGTDCCIATNADWNDLLFRIEQIRPVIMHRFNFLYKHRIVEMCCCDLQSECTMQHRCLSDDREMAMKCFWRKHIDDGSAYSKEKL
jgi:hypothetical protein